MGNTTFKNWNGTSRCRPSRILTPRTEADLQKIVRDACKSQRKSKRIRVVGPGVHTYGKISMCDDGDIIINLKQFNQVVKVDKAKKTVTAQAGIALENLLPHLERKDVRLALLNMGEITEQSLAGVTATGTHGSGGGGRGGKADSFSDQVIAYKVMELTPEANIRYIRKGDPDFTAFQTHLGALAIILEVTLQLVDWYHLEWKPAEIGSYKQLTTKRMQTRQQESYSCSYTYFPSTDEVIEIVRDRTTKTFESGLRSDVQDDFVSTLRQGATRCLRICPCSIEPYAKIQKRALLSLKGTDMWRKILSQGDLWGGVNLTIMTDLEYAMPLAKGSVPVALERIREILRSNKKILSVVGIRFVKGSNALMACHYSSRPDEEVFAYINVQLRSKKPSPELLRAIQTEVMKLGGRPHWGKYNTTTRELISKYDLWPAANLKSFLKVKAKYDPQNLLGNEYLDRALQTSQESVSTK